MTASKTLKSDNSRKHDHPPDNDSLSSNELPKRKPPSVRNLRKRLRNFSTVLKKFNRVYNATKASKTLLKTAQQHEKALLKATSSKTRVAEAFKNAKLFIENNHGFHKELSDRFDLETLVEFDNETDHDSETSEIEISHNSEPEIGANPNSDHERIDRDLDPASDRENPSRDHDSTRTETSPDSDANRNEAGSNSDLDETEESSDHEPMYRLVPDDRSTENQPEPSQIPEYVYPKIEIDYFRFHLAYIDPMRKRLGQFYDSRGTFAAEHGLEKVKGPRRVAEYVAQVDLTGIRRQRNRAIKTLSAHLMRVYHTPIQGDEYKGYKCPRLAGATIYRRLLGSCRVAMGYPQSQPRGPKPPCMSGKDDWDNTKNDASAELKGRIFEWSQKSNSSENRDPQTTCRRKVSLSI